jgi:hypothetical protein
MALPLQTKRERITAAKISIGMNMNPHRGFDPKPNRTVIFNIWLNPKPKNLSCSPK